MKQGDHKILLNVKYTVRKNERVPFYLLKAAQLKMCLCFIFSEEDSIPWRPFTMFIPSDHDQIIKIIAGTKS